MNIRYAGSAVAAGALAVAVLSGCSSSGTSTATASTSAASSSSPATSSSSSASSSASASQSGTATVSAAGQKFLGLTAPIDSDLQAFLGLPNSATVAQAQSAAGKLATAETTLVSNLKQATWPSAAQPDLTNLESTSTQEQAVYAKCAKSTSIASIKSVLLQDKATIAARVTPAAHVRAALGLPVATTTSPGTAASSTS